MPIFVGRKGIRGDIFHNTARVERLAADLGVIAQGELPSEQDLSSAPFIDAVGRTSPSALPLWYLREPSL